MIAKWLKTGAILCGLVASSIALGWEERAAAPAIDASKLFAQARPAVVVISVGDRTGKTTGVGTGFVLLKQGIVATNRHVIGQSRPLVVTTAEGKTLKVRGIHALSPKYDLALIAVEGEDLTALELGDSSQVTPGDPVIAVGNPQGLGHSVVAGIVSARREIDSMPMLQLALPVEPGNSGGPVLDRNGRVVGIVTMKSAVTDNLGFAMESNLLRDLLAHPQPVPMERWLTIGALDSKKWLRVFGSDWRQRAGRLLVSEPGESFGGRALCLSQEPPPALPYELAASVRLEREDGAAGLVFASDGNDRHYGFYPSGGSLRLTCFRGPDITEWTILEQVRSPHYVPGDWNRLKVRVEPDRIRCFVNDELVIESSDRTFRAGRVGLAKFRDTSASFRQFACATELAGKIGEEERARIDRGIDGATKGAVDPYLIEHAEHSAGRIDRRMAELERRVEELRHLKARLQEEATLAELVQATAAPEAEMDLLRAGLLLARLENSDVDPTAYLEEVDRMAEVVRSRVKDRPAAEVIKKLDRYLFDEMGFHGSQFDYAHRSNSYLNEVIDDREGLPITLSVLYLEMARRLGVPVRGLGLPGHFIVEYLPPDGAREYIDVFAQGKRLSAEDVKEIIVRGFDEPAEPEQFVASKKAIVARMLNNILSGAQQERNIPVMKRTLSALIAVEPDRIRERWQRGILALDTGDRDQAEADARWLLEKQPEGVDLEAVHQLLDLATRPLPGAGEGSP